MCSIVLANWIVMCYCVSIGLDRIQAHFESVQRIADTTTLPHAMQFLSSRIEEELELSHLTDRLMKGKDQPNTLTSSEKHELWDRLKILSMSRLVLFLLYVL